MKTRLILLTAVMALVAFVAISSTSRTQITGKTDDKFVTVAPIFESVTVRTGNDQGSTSASFLGRNNPREASCENPDVTTRNSVSEQERNAFLIESMKKIPSDATVEERAAFVEALRVGSPAQEFSRTIYTDNPEAVGDPPDPKQDQDGKKFDEWVEKVKKVGCETTPFRSSGGRLASPAQATFTSGWKSCTNSTWTTNSIGATLAKVTQTSKWYVDYRGIPSIPRRYFSTSAGWGWDEKGAPQGETGVVTIRYGVPLQYLNWTGQNFNFKHFGIELYTKYLEVEQYFGYQGRCSILPWWP